MPVIRVMIQRKVRKKKGCVLIPILGTVSHTGPNKMWSLKSLAMFKCESRNRLA